MPSIQNASSLLRPALFYSLGLPPNRWESKFWKLKRKSEKLRWKIIPGTSNLTEAARFYLFCVLEIGGYTPCAPRKTPSVTWLNLKWP